MFTWVRFIFCSHPKHHLLTSHIYSLDPTVRIVYAPLHKKSSTASRFLAQSRFSTTTYSQRIGIHNSKPSTGLASVRVIDQIAVSQNAEVVVKLLQPLLPPSIGPTKKGDTGITVQETPKVLARRVAGADGENGQLEWIVSDLPAKEKVELLLQWEVTVPEKTVLLWS